MIGGIIAIGFVVVGLIGFVLMCVLRIGYVADANIEQLLINREDNRDA